MKVAVCRAWQYSNKRTAARRITRGAERQRAGCPCRNAPLTLLRVGGVLSRLVPAASRRHACVVPSPPDLLRATPAQ